MKRANQKDLRACLGFTLFDLLVSLAIAVITLSIAVPSASSIIQQNRLASHINKLVASLNIARAEAVARGRNVVICRSDTAGTLNPNCKNSIGSWSDGWLVFENTDNDLPAFRDAGEPVLQVFAGLESNYLLDSSSVFDDAISFNATGDVTTGGEFVLCKDNDAYYSRSITVDRTGNVAQSTRDSFGVLTRRDGTTVGACAAL